MSESDQPQLFKNRYKVAKKLGAGNFGTAYLVTDLKAKQELKVLKVVRLGEMDAEQSVDSKNEAELLAELNHEHIVKFYESFLDNDCLCIVTEFCEGGDLDQRFKELKKQNILLEENQIVEWLIQILLAVQYMHKSRILHRDLKARNIFLKSNRVKIGDFGISRILVGTMDVATTFTGTPYYMSPEVMKHDGYESKSDIWSVGCLLYEMCTYQHAFDGKGLMNVIYKVVEGKPPSLPDTYSSALNDLLMKMFTKDPKERPSAVQLLESPFILYHRQRLHMNGPLESTISGHRRLKQIHSRFENPMNFSDMQRQGWSLQNQNHLLIEEDDDPQETVDDDDDDVQLGNNTFYNRNQMTSNTYEDDYEQPTLKADKTVKTERQTMIERKKQAADARAQLLTEAIRSNVYENAVNRQLMRESTMIGTMKQPWPSTQNTDVKEQPVPRLSKTLDNRSNGSNPRPNEATFVVRKTQGRLGTSQVHPPLSHDDRPITPMRVTYTQIADKFNKDIGLPTDPTLTNQYYAACNDFEQEDDQSPTRELREREFTEQIIRSFNGHQGSPKLERPLSVSERSTMNSLSRTIDPRPGPNPTRQSRYLASSRTVSSAKKSKTSSKSAAHDANTSFRDSPAYDAYGPMAKDKKIKSLRNKAIETLGLATFNRIHDYLIQQRSLQRTDSTLNEARINEDLRKFDAKPSDCFLVDQLVFLELVSNEK